MTDKLKSNLYKLKDKHAVDMFLHDVYLHTVKGAILETFTDENIFDAWADMQFFVDDLYVESGLISAEERDNLVKFVNTVYLEFCEDKTRLKNSIIDIQKTLYKERGDDEYGKSERRRNVNCGRDTQRNGGNGKSNRTDGEECYRRNRTI